MAGSGATDRTALDHLRLYRRAANYLAAAQVYLRSNALLREPLRAEHIKPRLLGHWGTSPGINLVYAHLDRVVVERGASVLLVTGPGHGAGGQPGQPLPRRHAGRVLPPDDTRPGPAWSCSCAAFRGRANSPAHLVPGTPAPSTRAANWATRSRRPSARRWTTRPWSSPASSATARRRPVRWPVRGTQTDSSIRPPPARYLPILHDNGFKISSATISGTMTDDELRALYTGYGWQPRIVAGDDDRVDDVMADSTRPFVRRDQPDPGRRARRRRGARRASALADDRSCARPRAGPVRARSTGNGSRARSAPTRCRRPTCAPTRRTWRSSNIGCARTARRSCSTPTAARPGRSSSSCRRATHASA